MPVMFGYARDTSLGSFLFSEARGWRGYPQNKGECKLNRPVVQCSTNVACDSKLVMVQIEY